MEPTDAPGVAAALVSLVTDREAWSVCRRSGLARVRDFSWEAHARRYLAVLDEACGGGDAHPTGAEMEGAARAAGADAHAPPPSEAPPTPSSPPPTPVYLPWIPPKFLVGLLMDTRDAPSAAALLANALPLLPPSSSVVVLSSHGLAPTQSALASAGVDASRIFCVASDCGASLWYKPDGGWEGNDARPCDEWAAAVSHKWAPAAVARAVVSAAGGALALVDDDAPPEGSAPGGRSLLRFRVAPGAAAVPSAAAVHRRLRRKGLRATLHFCAGGEELRALPTRASRALALRRVAATEGVPLRAVLLLRRAGGAGAEDGDANDATEGLPAVVVVGGAAQPQEPPAADGGPAGDQAAAAAAERKGRVTWLSDDASGLEAAIKAAVVRAGTGDAEEMQQ